MRKGQDGRSWTHDLENRNEQCKDKDKNIIPYLEKIPIKDPKTFHAILMPAINGPELKILTCKGVLPSNIWAIESCPRSFKRMLEASKLNDNPLSGVRLTRKPMSSDKAICEIESDSAENNYKFNLIYLDYLGQPSVEHCKLLDTIFRLKMLDIGRGAILILNFGSLRTDNFTSILNKEIENKSPFLPTIQYVNQALTRCEKLDWKHPLYNNVKTMHYKGLQRTNGSRPNFVISAFSFESGMNQ